MLHFFLLSKIFYLFIKMNDFNEIDIFNIKKMIGFYN
jgi:hypothetical protein